MHLVLVIGLKVEYFARIGDHAGYGGGGGYQRSRMRLPPT